MSRIVDWIQSLAPALGAPGLFASAFLDSSFLSLPEVNDLLLVWLTMQHKTRMLLYAASATMGSIVGCLILYYIGQKGSGIADRFGTKRVERTLATIQRYGILAVVIPALLPPPAPFKIFVLLAGVAEIPVSRFVLALAFGRGLRYFGLGFLALRFGDRAVEYIHANGRMISLTALLLLAAGLAGYLLRAKARSRRGR